MLIRILFLLLVSITTLKSMEDRQQEPVQREQQITSNWDFIPEETKQHILSFVPKTYQDLVKLMLTDKETERLVSDQLFLQVFAKKAFEADPDRTKKLLQAAATHGNVVLTKVLINTDEALKEYAETLLCTRFSMGLEKHKQNRETEIMVETLLKAGTNPNAQYPSLEPRYAQSRPLFLASYLGELKLAELLIAYGADVNAKNNDGQDALFFAILADKPDLVKLLLEQGSTLESAEKAESRLWYAVQQNSIQSVEILLNYGATVNGRVVGDASPLLCALWFDSPEMVKLLLAHGADTTIPSNNGPLSFVSGVLPDYMLKILEEADKDRTSGQ